MGPQTNEVCLGVDDLKPFGAMKFAEALIYRNGLKKRFVHACGRLWRPGESGSLLGPEKQIKYEWIQEE